MTETAELTGRQHEIMISRLETQVERIIRSKLSEAQKLIVIGKHVDGAITDLTDPGYKAENLPLEPSILPEHDDTTIDRLARMERILSASQVSRARQRQILESMELGELRRLRDNRASH